ncbi:hypothetical protein HHL24_40920 [Paraburkholderia sp. RP-4-7]|uniref:Uncharacterized protein n=1 Tax=Paraburkholderia polaris TaxID=2728848 RepID=A0A848ISZ8_9BURK|nr:hypothetical protein [Paraburkholderia polaris]NMM04206.1 hypothetical protein [Paraburkholderia polaris]
MTDSTSAIGVVDAPPDEPVEDPVVDPDEEPVVDPDEEPAVDPDEEPVPEPVLEFDDDPAGEPFELDVVEEPGFCPESVPLFGLLLFPPPHPAKISAEIKVQQMVGKKVCFMIVSFCILCARSPCEFPLSFIVFL